MTAIRVAIPDMISPSYFPAIAAVELGFFKQEGLDAGIELGRHVVDGLAEPHVVQEAPREGLTVADDAACVAIVPGRGCVVVIGGARLGRTEHATLRRRRPLFVVDLDDHSAVLASDESAVGHEMRRDLDEDFLEDACAP